MVANTDPLQVEVAFNQASADKVIRKFKEIETIKFSNYSGAPTDSGINQFQKMIDALTEPVQKLQMKMATSGVENLAGETGIGAGDIVEAVMGMGGNLLAVLGPIAGLSILGKAILDSLEPILEMVKIAVAILVMPLAAILQTLLRPVLMLLVRFMLLTMGSMKTIVGFFTGDKALMAEGTRNIGVAMGNKAEAQATTDQMTTLWSGLGNIFVNIFTSIKGIGDSVLEGIKTALIGINDTVFSVLDTMLGTVQALISIIPGSQGAQDAIQKLRDGLGGMKTDIDTKITTGIDSVKTSFDTLIDGLISKSKEPVSPFKKLQDSFDSLTSAAISDYNAIKKALADIQAAADAYVAAQSSMSTPNDILQLNPFTGEPIFPSTPSGGGSSGSAPYLPNPMGNGAYGGGQAGGGGGGGAGSLNININNTSVRNDDDIKKIASQVSSVLGQNLKRGGNYNAR